MLPRLVDTKEILRGKVFDVALPFTKGRPLDFVKQSESDPNLFSIVSKDDGFEGIIDPVTKKKKSEIVKIVTEFKLRPSLIIQLDEYNQNDKYPFTVILPLANVSEEQKKRKTFQDMMTYNNLNQFYYLGHNSYVTVNDPQRIYKNLLFKRDHEITIDPTIVDEIMKRFAECFEIKEIRQCDTCEHNCKNCEFKKAVNK